MWAARIMHEASLYDDQSGNCFLTLTYRDEWDCSLEERKNGYHIPSDGSLHPSHLQKFIKRVRKKYAPKKIRFFAVGEYGEETNRPHYHVILFNHDFSDSVAIREKEGIWLYESDELSGLWPYGFSTVGSVTFESAAYCARYCLKKITGPQAEEHYERFDPELGYYYQLHPEFTRMSLKPGVGYDWFKRYETDFFPRDECPIPGRSTIKKTPRYYEKILELSDDEMLMEVKEARKQFRMENRENYTPKALMDAYTVKKAQIKLLKREL